MPTGEILTCAEGVAAPAGGAPSANRATPPATRVAQRTVQEINGIRVFLTARASAPSRTGRTSRVGGVGYDGGAMVTVRVPL